MSSVPHPASDLLKRSHRLGSDARNTNYAGGNTSAREPGLIPSPVQRSNCCGSRAQAATWEL